MKIKLIGLGQCGSFVVYDVIAYLFDHKTSKDIKAGPQTQWKRDVHKVTSWFKSKRAALSIKFKKYFKGLKTADIPQFFVVDGNRNNAVVDGLQGDDINKRLGALKILVAALSLAKRNNGCSFGQVGEYEFCKEKKSGASNNVFNKLRFDEEIDINALIFAGGGGSGSGGAPVLNAEARSKDSLLFNFMILPPSWISDRRQAWNTGRSIMRLATIQSQTALLLFSNLSESLGDQYSINQYIRKLVVRLANFGYAGNIPRVATDIDKKDLQVFFSGNPAFVGLSSLKQDDPSKENILEMVNQALTPIVGEDPYGLSIEYPEAAEQKLFNSISKILIVLGLTPKYKDNVKIVDIVKQQVAARTGRKLSELDCRAYSYTSLDEIELTVFFRHNNYRSNFLLEHFLDSYLEWHNNEKFESEYLMQEVTQKPDNSFLKEVRMALDEDADVNFSDWLEKHFKYPINSDLETIDPRNRKTPPVLYHWAADPPVPTP
jgi:hypothetical protein